VPKVIHFLQQGEAEGGDGRVDFARMTLRSPMFCVPPKVILRAAPGIWISQGNHKIHANHDAPVTYAGGSQYGFYHREFQTRSFAHFVRKVRNGGAAILAARAESRDVGGEHWLRWYATLQAEGEAGLWATYQKQCFRDPGGSYIIDPWVPGGGG
jgi:hypothetical protein